MIKSLKITLAAAAAMGGVALSGASASAMPVVGSAVAPAAEVHGNVQDVRLVCGPFRCFYRPGFYGYYGYRPFYGRRFFWGPRYRYYGRRFYW